jgi:hypothetical protein
MKVVWKGTQLTTKNPHTRLALIVPARGNRRAVYIDSLLKLPENTQTHALTNLSRISIDNIVTRLSVTVDGVLDWQLDLLLQSHTQARYNRVSPDSLSLTTHDWIYHNNSAANITAATLVTGELQVPFLPWLPTHSTQLQQLSWIPTTPTLQLAELWTLNSLGTELWIPTQLRSLSPLGGRKRRQCFRHWLSNHHQGNGYAQF